MSNREAVTGRQIYQNYQTRHLHRNVVMVLTPLLYHSENVGSQSDGGNKWLLFTGPKEDTAANLK